MLNISKKIFLYFCFIFLFSFSNNFCFIEESKFTFGFVNDIEEARKLFVDFHQLVLCDLSENLNSKFDLEQELLAQGKIYAVMLKHENELLAFATIKKIENNPEMVRVTMQ